MQRKTQARFRTDREFGARFAQNEYTTSAAALRETRPCSADRRSSISRYRARASTVVGRSPKTRSGRKARFEAVFAVSRSPYVVDIAWAGKAQ